MEEIIEKIRYEGPSGKICYAYENKYFDPKNKNYYDSDSTGEDLTPEKLIAVHLTDTFPEDGVIHTPMFYDKLTWRDSIHFSMNHSVGGHAYGNWDDRKHAILIPFEKFISKIAYFCSVDTFAMGDLEIPLGSNILTREGQDTIEETVNQKIQDLGYVNVNGGGWNWNYGDSWWPSDFESFLKRENLEYGNHSNTPYHWLESLSPSNLVYSLLKNEGCTRTECQEKYDTFVKEKSLDEIVYFVRKNVPENYEENRERAREFLEKTEKIILPEYPELVKSTYEL
jgi:hypothetical protein